MAESHVPHPLRSSQENTNGAKLSRLIVDGGTAVCRNAIKVHYPTAASLASTLTNHQGTFRNLLRKKVINQKQLDQLFPSSGYPPDLESFDITLLIILLRNICCNLPAPIQGWDTEPSPLDTSQSANLLRIKYFRNEVAHASHTGISSADFESRWNAIFTVLVALGMDSSEIERLKVSPLDEEKYLKILFECGDQERNVKQHLQKIATDQEENGRMLEQIKQKQDKILEHVQKAKTQEKRFGNIRFKSDEFSMIGKQGLKGTCVYRGKLLSNDQDVAIKKIFVGLADWNKALALRELKHPNIVRCFAAEQTEDFIYIALELCDKTLAEFIQQGDFASEVLSRMLCLVQVAKAVKYLHEQGWFHRDIKPGNVLVTRGDDASTRRFVLADVNISKETHDETFSTKKPTAGDFGWIANEVYHPGYTASTKSDIFSLGCMFYYTLTNMKHPFGDGNNLEECQKNIQCRREAVLTTGHFVELPNLERLISTMVMHSPDKRPTAATVCDSLY